MLATVIFLSGLEEEDVEDLVVVVGFSSVGLTGRTSEKKSHKLMHYKKHSV